VHLAPEELKELYEIAEKIGKGESIDPKTVTPFKVRPRSADIAMFGRMLAGIPKFNVEAAAQVAHAFTTHRSVVEDDYFTAVDELKAQRREADKGAGFVGVQEFGTGLFYLYACVNASLLVANLQDDTELASKTAAAFIEALAKTSPAGKQNSFASRAFASYALVETGCQQPRSLAAAFLKPVAPSDGEGDLFEASVERLTNLRHAYDAAYGACSDASREMKLLPKAEGSLADLVQLAANAARNAKPLGKHRDAA
jgi:CRISPR system Cascade subunit CasC